MKGYFRIMFRKFCLEGTVLGLKYFYLYPDPISRCFWALNMVAVLSLAFLLSYLLYDRFEEMPTRITIENQYEPVQNLPYPTIIICSPNQITISFMNHFNRTLVDGNLTLNIETILPKLLGFYEIVGDLNHDDLLHLQTLLGINRYTVSEVMGAIPQSCDSFLKLCYFEQKLYPNCATLFQPILTQHGLCCAFNSLYFFKGGKINVHDTNFVNRMVRGSGMSGGLTVVTDHDPADAIDGTIVNAGAIRVMYTDWTEFPAVDESDLVDVNAESHHVIRATYTYCSEDVTALPAWSRKCFFEHESQLPFFKGYHNSDCDLMCFALAVQKMCNCWLFFIPHVHLPRTCNLTSIACVMRAKPNLGGVLGLCLGCSFISVLEILFYMYLAVRNYIRARVQQTWRQGVGYHL